MYAPERLHAVRIAAKKLRYGLELAADSGLKQAAPHVRTIKRAQDMLGKLHDLQVLQTHVAAVQAEPRTGRPREALEDLASDTSRGSAATCTDATWRHRSRLREAATAVRKVIVPQLAHTPTPFTVDQDDVVASRRRPCGRGRSVTRGDTRVVPDTTWRGGRTR